MQYVYFGVSFGVTMIVFLYFGYQGGQWLDLRFDTEPIFTMAGILLGVGITFRTLLDRLLMMEKYDKNKKKK